MKKFRQSKDRKVLQLDKETVRRLTDDELGSVAGGSGRGCPPTVTGCDDMDCN